MSNYKPDSRIRQQDKLDLRILIYYKIIKITYAHKPSNSAFEL